jgi:dCTP deaminase
MLIPTDNNSILNHSSLLNDKAIVQYLKEGKIKIDPIDFTEQIQPASVDLKLGDTFSYIKSSVIDFREEIEYDTFKKDELWIQPMQFVLATTKEYVGLPNNITGLLEGRSSIGRTGLFIHNAGLIDAGFEGEITLELFNCGPAPILLTKDQRICQITFWEHDEALIPYRGKYQGQRGATGSRVHLDHLKD